MIYYVLRLPVYNRIERLKKWDSAKSVSAMVSMVLVCYTKSVHLSLGYNCSDIISNIYLMNNIAYGDIIAKMHHQIASKKSERY
jgi:hypothetical protein